MRVMSFYLHIFNRFASMTPLQMAQRMAIDARDEALLCDLCALAQNSPTAMRALHWALINDIRVSLAPREGNTLGTYSTADNYVRLNLGRGTLDRDALLVALGTLVHEIRHAWQDAHGLLPHISSSQMRYGRLDYALAQNALVEADAHTYGMTAVAEVTLGKREAEALGQDLRLEGMQGFFRDWFATRAQSYGDKMREQHAASFTRSEGSALDAPTGINPYCRTELLRLGRDFSGNANYIAGINPDHFTKFYLAPTEILRDYREDADIKGADVRVSQLRNRTSLYTQLRSRR